jgi:hypothetical protein
MSKPKKKTKAAKRQLPKNTKEWEALSSDEVMTHIFGKAGHEVLKDQLLTDDAPTDSDQPLP